MVTYLRYLLFPFSLLYGLVILIRNQMFDSGMLKSSSFDLPVICIGNLAIGGSGKTPLTEYIVKLLDNKRVAILSRGYGRSTKGFVLADASSTADSIGDEPLQYFHKFSHITVAVCEDRKTGINLLKENHDVILLDDAFQHRKVRAGLQILLFEFSKFSKLQLLLPAGDLREPFCNYKRADLVVITKTPLQAEKNVLNSISNRFTPASHIPVLFSHLAYGDLMPVYKSRNLSPRVNKQSVIYLITGIANPEPMVTYLNTKSNVVLHHEYRDHHKFGRGNITDLVNAFSNDTRTEKVIITTEKDAQRLLDASLKVLLLDLPIFYLPIQVVLNEADKSTFDQNILKYVSSTTRNR
jgi:tetraacyldisaccharide 4'-kinase